MVSDPSARKKARVLVVDDDVDLLALLEAGLEDGGFDVDVCGSAERALELLEVAAHDIILTDINLPGMSGLDFCSRVVSDRANVVVMVMTAFSSIKSAVTALRAGAYDYLMKPLDIDALVEVHDEAELDTALEAGARIVGVNHRDLRTFEIDHARFERLRPRIPAGVVSVAESGIHDAATAARLFDAGADAILVGEHLAAAPDPAAAARALLGRA